MDGRVCCSLELKRVTELVNYFVYKELLILVDNFKTGIMNFKPTARPPQLNPYSQSCCDPYPYRIMIPKKITQHADQSNSKLLSTMRKACLRCNNKQATSQCYQCSKSILCPKCDQSVHSIGKFQVHRRIPLMQTSIEQSCNSNFSKLNFVTEEDNIQQEILISTKISISQTWDNIISEVSQKFKQAIDSMKDKKKQIIEKIEKKRDQDIKYYQASKNLYSEIRKYPKKGSLEHISNQYQISSKLLTLNNEETQHRIDKKYKASFTLIEEVQTLVEKIDVKNTLVRVLEQQPLQTIKKSMKRSLIVSPNASIGHSPGTKTPVHAKKLSQSTIEADPLEFGYKISIPGKKILFESQKESKLGKIKSQKVLCKSPTNMSKYTKEKPTIKKGLKQGQ